MMELNEKSEDHQAHLDSFSGGREYLTQFTWLVKYFSLDQRDSEICTTLTF